MRELPAEPPVDLCLPDGRLNPRAHGWSRGPHVRCRLPRAVWGRRKRWHHWSVVCDEAFLTVTVADIDVLSLGALWLVDLRSGRRLARTRVAPLGRLELPERVGGGAVRFAKLGLDVALGEEAGGTRIEVHARGLDADLFVPRPAGHETLNLVAPLDERRYLYSSKDAGRPARGEIRAFGRRIEVAGHGSLDFGRGTWPARTGWSWGSAAGAGGAFNLGASWTDGTGVNENAFWIGGRLHKIFDEVRFEGDAVRAPDVDLRFTPLEARRVGGGLGPVSVGLDLRIGRWQGCVREAAVAGWLGWYERFHARW